LCPSVEGWGPVSTSRPIDLTTCFQFGVLVFGVNLTFLIAAIMRLCKLQFLPNLPLSLVIGLLQSVAVAVAVKLHYKEQHVSRVASTLLLLFWLATTLVSLIRLRTTVIMNIVEIHYSLVIIANGLFAISALVSFILELQPKPIVLFETNDGNTIGSMSNSSKDNHATSNIFEERANIFSRMTVSWITPLIKKGYYKQLQLEDTCRLDKQFHPRVVTEVFQHNWQEELESGKASLFRAIVRTYGAQWMLSAFYKLLRDLATLLNPLLLSRLIGFVMKFNTDMAEPIEYGYFYAISMYLIAAAGNTIFRLHWAQNHRIKIKMRTSLVTAIYQKAMTISNDTRQKYDFGSIVTHMSVDAERISEFTTVSSYQLISSPARIVLIIYMLYQKMGWSIVAGILVLLSSIPVSTHITHKMKKLNRLIMKHRDQRIKIMNETLLGIKVVKLHAWESYFIKCINKVRIDLEMATIRRYALLQALFSFVVTLAPFMVSFSTFALYSLADSKSHGPLTPQLVFVALALFNLLELPLMSGSKVVAGLYEAQISTNRILDFLTSSEVDCSAIDRKPYNRDNPDTGSEDVMLLVKDGTFKWLLADVPSLRNINIQCKRNELVAVVGRVASGKSSLVSAILGDMIKCSGSVSIYGNVAYVPQQPWILNATLRENILFGNEYDQEFYKQVIDACALQQDVDALPAGNLTEIGDRGITLSGGQKMRVSLARAVYSRANIYFFDDPLAAVDAHVGKHIFTHVLGPQGILRSHARILITNDTQHLSEANSIVILENGNIIESGSYDTIMDKSSRIFDIKSEHFDIKKENNSVNSSTIGTASIEMRSDSTMLSNASSKQSLDKTNDNTIHEEPGKKTQCTRKAVAGADAQDAGKTTTVEFINEGEIMWSKYYSYAKACGIYNTLLFLAALVLASVSNVGANMWLKNWSSANISHNTELPRTITLAHSKVYYLVIYGGLGLLGALLSSLRLIILWTRCSVRASVKIHQDMINGIMHSPMSFFEVTPMGRILNRFTTDLVSCDRALPKAISLMSNKTASAISAIVVIIISTPLIIFVLIPLSLIYRKYQKLYINSSRDLKRLQSTLRSPIIAHFQETTSGVSSIRAYGHQSRFIREIENRMGQHIRVNYTFLAINRWLSVRLENLGDIVMLGTTLLSIISLHFFGIGNAGLVGLGVSYALKLSNSLNWAVRHSNNIENSMTSFERAIEYADLPSEAPSVIEDNRPKQAWPAQGVIEFRNYAARYRDGLDLAIKDLSFHVLPRQKVGIVGRTGAGKSSLALSLFRIIEAASGQILLDGEDISKYGLLDVRSKLSIIPQDPTLFAGTVRENLDPFNSYSDQKIWRALEQAHLADYIRTKDERLEFMVAHGGENFSGGQRQLICLARALLKHAKVLVIDEATASIDNETDKLTQQTIRREFKDCTVLTIAHRLDTVINNDMILVIDDGRLVEYDTPQNLLANKNSIFTKLFQE
ncbi:P-loop containing nucleoside triphosphate hydrolase protein, partial [Coemansia reversa NRRL 1564]